MKRIFGVLIALLIFPSLASGQSLLSRGGLGIPVLPVDAHAKGLANLGIGLRSGNFVPSDPGSIVDLDLPTLSFTFQSSTGTFARGGTEGDLEGTRFPMIGIGYPAGRFGVFTLSFGSLFDQRWIVADSSSVEVQGEDVPILDQFESDGGVSVVSVGWGRRIARWLGVTVSGGRFAGSVRRNFARNFADPSLLPDTTGGKWSFSGTVLEGGLVLDPTDFFRISGSVRLSDPLTSSPEDGTGGEVSEFEMPTVIRGGVNLLLTPTLSVVASGAHADWSETDNPDQGIESVGTVFDYGTGVEWRGFRVGGRTLPLRGGYRSVTLPFLFEGEEIEETFFTGGIGLSLSADGSPLIARIDLSAEVGERKGISFAENLTRLSATFRLSGF